MSEIALPAQICPKTANFQLANYLSERFFEVAHGNYLLCLPQALLQEITLVTFSIFLEPGAEKQSPEQFAQYLIKDIFNLFYQYSGVSVRIHLDAHGCLYLDHENAIKFQDSMPSELKKSLKTDCPEFDSIQNIADDSEMLH